MSHRPRTELPPGASRVFGPGSFKHSINEKTARMLRIFRGGSASFPPDATRKYRGWATHSSKLPMETIFPGIHWAVHTDGTISFALVNVAIFVPTASGAPRRPLFGQVIHTKITTDKAQFRARSASSAEQIGRSQAFQSQGAGKNNCRRPSCPVRPRLRLGPSLPTLKRGTILKCHEVRRCRHLRLHKSRLFSPGSALDTACSSVRRLDQ